MCLRRRGSSARDGSTSAFRTTVGCPSRQRANGLDTETVVTPPFPASAHNWLTTRAAAATKSRTERRTVILRMVQGHGELAPFAAVGGRTTRCRAAGTGAHRCVDDLPPVRRAAVELRVVHELPHEQAARCY